MKVDLHCHSYYSDGKHSPEFLIESAIVNGVSHLAITDHDCVDAFSELNKNRDEITILNGVEISCDWLGLEVHIVGLLIDTENASLGSLLRNQQSERRSRIEAMDKKLKALGVDDLLPWMEKQKCVAMTRSHVADFLVEKGLSKNRQKAFKRYLAKRGKIYVAANWCSLQSTVQSIHGAGGIAVLAHPGRYPLSKGKLKSLVEEFAGFGGDAIETSYSNIDPLVRNRLSDLAEEHQLYASVGSDFHDEAATWTRLGKYPEPDQQSKKNAIWLHPKWHFE
jgi:3',5'-nucleoside bisphosphate phosphatase